MIKKIIVQIKKGKIIEILKALYFFRNFFFSFLLPAPGKIKNLSNIVKASFFPN